MRKSLQLSASLIVLSAWDIFKARLFLLITLAYLASFPSLLLNLAALSKKWHRSPFILIPLFFLLLGAAVMIGRWSAQTEKDIHNGNTTGFRSLWNQTSRSTFHRPLVRPPIRWLFLSLPISLMLPLLNLSLLYRLTPVLYLLLPPLMPFLALIVITRDRLSAEFTAPPRPESKNILNTDRTRPMSSFAPPAAADQTVSAVANTNPAGFTWSEENRQALLLDIITGHITFEKARKRFGLKIEELQSWLDEYMRQNQAPQKKQDDIPGDGNIPA